MQFWRLRAFPHLLQMRKIRPFFCHITGTAYNMLIYCDKKIFQLLEILATCWTYCLYEQDLPGALDDAAVTEALELHKIKIVSGPSSRHVLLRVKASLRGWTG